MHGRTMLVVALLVTAGVTPGVAGGANTPPRADAGLDRTVRVGETVFLDGGGSADPDGRITDYEWTIRSPRGDRTTTAGERARFVPDETGQYAVTLTVTDDDGATRRDTAYVTVGPGDDSRTETPARTPTGTPADGSAANERPRGTLSGPPTVERGETATYRAQVYDPDGRVAAVAWTNGETGRTVTRTFTEPPGTTVVVGVTVRDDDGATRRVTKRVTVVGGERNDPPSAQIDGPSYLRVGESATFQLVASDTDGTVTDHTWTAPVSARGPTLTRTFTEPGSYTVRAVARDDDGATDVATHRVEVVAGDDDPPVASLSGPEFATDGTKARYEVDATDPDGGSVHVEWLTGSPDTDQTLDPDTVPDLDSGFARRVLVRGDPGDTVTVRARVTDDEGNAVVVSTDTRVIDTEATQSSGDAEPSARWVGLRFDPDQPKQTNDSDVIRGKYHLRAWVGHDTGEPVTVTWSLGDGVEKTIRVREPNRTVSIAHTFLSQTGGKQSRRIEITITDPDGQTATVSKSVRVQTLKRGATIRATARANGRRVDPGGRLQIPAGTLVVFRVFSFQPFEIEVGDDTRYTAPGTSGSDARLVTHRYDTPGERIAVVTSLDGNGGISVAQFEIDVHRTGYTEYRYREAVTRTEVTTAVSEPPGDGWERTAVADTRVRPTGETRRLRRGTPLQFDTGPNRRLVKVGTERETVERTDRRVATERPGPAWSLAQRRVDRRTETRTETRTTWRDSRYSFGVWELVGSRTTRETVSTTGTDSPGAGWRWAGDTGRDRLSGYTYTWRGSAAGSSYTGRRDCVRHGRFGGERVCLDYRYLHRTPDYENVYRWEKTTYDTDYEYQRTVTQEVTVWAHEWTRTRTETIVYDVYEERESVVEWRWERSHTVAGRVTWALDRPPAGAYANGTLTAFDRRCDTDAGHFDDRVCE